MKTIKQHLSELPEPYDDEIENEHDWIDSHGSIEDWMKEDIAEEQRLDSNELGY